MAFIRIGGAIDGKVNPVLTVAEGQIVQLTLINDEGAEHDVAFSDQDPRSPRVTGEGASTTIAFRGHEATVVEFKSLVPGNYTLVDHALSRAERSLAGILHVEESNGDNRSLADPLLTAGSTATNTAAADWPRSPTDAARWSCARLELGCDKFSAQGQLRRSRVREPLWSPCGRLSSPKTLWRAHWQLTKRPSALLFRTCCPHCGQGTPVDGSEALNKPICRAAGI